MKRCIGCGDWKDLSDFSKCKANKDGHLNQCRPCDSQYMKKYRADNKEMFAKRDKKYRETHKEQIAKLAREYQQTHKKEGADRVKKHRKTKRQKEVNHET